MRTRHATARGAITKCSTARRRDAAGPAGIRIILVRRLLVLLLLALPASAVTVDRIAAVVDRQVLTVSEITQLVEIRFFPRHASDDEAHRREVLDALIAQALRYRDVERFGAQDIPADTIEARLLEMQGRFASEADFLAAVARAELTLDEVRALIKRQLQVEAYIQERFAPLVFITNEEIAEYYRGEWTRQRRERGLDVPPLDAVREEIRVAVRGSRVQEEIGRWTSQLRERANVDPGAGGPRRHTWEQVSGHATTRAAARSALVRRHRELHSLETGEAVRALRSRRPSPPRCGRNTASKA
jgi:hypothetical protein